MNKNVFDSDRHVIEPPSLWSDYVDQDIIKEFPVTLKFNRINDIQLPPEYMIGDHQALNYWDIETQLGVAIKSRENYQQSIDAMQPQSQLTSMDNSGISQASIFPTFAGYIVNHQAIPADVSLAYADGYNRWLKDYCDCAPDRLMAVGLISRHAPHNMVAQLEKIVSYGWTCITLRPEIISGRSLGHADYEAFWQACSKYKISIALHGGTNLQAPAVGTDRYTSRFALHACAHPMEIQMAFLSLLESGVLERYPTLKFGLFEAGASWIPHWLWRLDNICYPEFPALIGENIKMLPSDYFKRQCWVTIEINEPCLPQVIAMIGHDKLLFGTDFPHLDHLHFDPLDMANVSTGISAAMLEDLLQNNPKTFFGC